MNRRQFAGRLALLVPAGSAAARSKSAALAPERIRSAADYSAANRGKSLLVLQQGRVVFEDYPNGFAANGAHKIYSGTKAFWCLAGLAAQEEGILRLDERAADSLAEWAGDRLRSRITIRQLLDFTSGLDPFFELHEDGIGNRNALALHRALVAEPGDAFIYGPCSLQVFSEVLRRKLAARGETPAAYLERRVLRPMGLGSQRYVQDRAGNPLLAAGFILSARQWAQMGRAILNQLGRHIVSAEAVFDACLRGSRVNAAFGLGFWNNNAARRFGAREVDVEEMLEEQWPRQRWRNACLCRAAPADLGASIGSGSQRLYVVPSRSLIVVRQGQSSRFSDGAFLRLLFGGE